jgi:hypothetical protein
MMFDGLYAACHRCHVDSGTIFRFHPEIQMRNNWLHPGTDASRFHLVSIAQKIHIKMLYRFFCMRGGYHLEIKNEKLVLFRPARRASAQAGADHGLPRHRLSPGDPAFVPVGALLLSLRLTDSVNVVVSSRWLIPFLLLDLFLYIYLMVCFSVYGIPKV